MKRRDVLKATALGALLAKDLAFGQSGTETQAPRAPAGDRIRVGMIGVGGFGLGANLPDFLKNPDVEVAAICDVNEQNLEKGVALAGGKAKRFKDYRRLLEEKEIDAVVITTPEWWHSIMCIDACDAGKDVYVEKPLGRFVREGRLAVEAARRNNRVVQMGTQQRSGAHFQRAVKYVQDGRIGDVYYATCWHHSPPPSSPQAVVTGEAPAHLDYDLWLGPAPMRPYAELMSGGRRRYWDYWGHPEVSDTSQQHGPHVRNFLDCVKSRQRPIAEVAAGQAANTVCRLGNIAYRLGRRIQWDAAKEQAIGDAEAQKLVIGTYRDPWKPKGL